jgi:hypothetical protein
LKQLSQQLRALKRKRKRLEATRFWTPVGKIKRLAVLIYELSDEFKWSAIFVKSWQARNIMRTLSLPCEITPTMLLGWQRELLGDPELARLKNDASDSDRMNVDKFLIESLVYEEIIKQSRKGITVPSSIVLAKYLRMWSMRPMSAPIREFCNKLRDSEKQRRIWSRAFRRRWGVIWGGIEPTHGISNVELKAKVFTIQLCCVGLPM